MSKRTGPELGTRFGVGVVTRVADLEPGDMIAEVDAPDGPWYQVVAREKHSITLDARLAADEPELLISLEFSLSAWVLRRIP
jgi:crotonobetainyl-CoA:carnitine CoA-transferase CaiB-like acyl-CoA transferase